MRTLVFASLAYYRGVHAMVVVGVAVAVAVLAGALMVGASVRASLRELALARLGNAAVVASSPQFFRVDLGTAVTAQPLIATTGALVHEPSGRTAARVQVYGIDDGFLRFHGIAGRAPRGREAWISQALAEELHATPRDALLLRVAKPTDIPLGTLQGRREATGERVRLDLARVSDKSTLGEFSLTPSQGPALTVFVAIDRLQADFDMAGRANTLLAPAPSDAFALERAIASRAELEDYALRLRAARDPQTIVVETRAGVMSETLAGRIVKAAESLGAESEATLIHLANSIRIGDREVPYSTVAGRAMSSSAALNEWAARDLGARSGDVVELEYFVWSDTAGLETRRTQFTVSGVVPMTAEGGDPTFTPDYPGLTDADSVSDWDPPFPVDLRRVRAVDEQYWDQYGAAPKLFLPLEAAQRLWATPHGSVSSVRVTAPAGEDPSAFADRLAAAIEQHLTPSAGGFVIRNARAEALAAAEGTTDFGEYFVYFSFFLVLAGLLLAGLFFTLAVDQRAREIGVLQAVGYSRRDVLRLLLSEALVLAALGSAVGTVGAIGYAAVIMYGLRTWWRDAVGTSVLTLHIDPLWLMSGATAAMIAALAALALALRAAFARSPRALLGGDPNAVGGLPPARAWSSRVALITTLAAVAVFAATATELIPQVAGFFGVGSLLMGAGLAGLNARLRRSVAGVAQSSVLRFGAAYAHWRPTRSVLSAALITFACFVIVSVGAFRRDGGASLDRSSGTGGFVLLAESVAALMHNPNTPQGRMELGLDGAPALEGSHISRFRLRPGDDASCLTLYQPRNPRIVAPEPTFLDENRFRFATSLAASAEERQNPWRLLQRRFDDHAIPAIADQTSLTYVFHLGVGDDFVFTDDSGRERRLRIVGALSDSVLQSELIIPEYAFVEMFPHREGYGLWLVETPEAMSPTVTTVLEDRLADFGVDVIDTRARLAAYHRVENTYLSTFQALGALGLLVGTLGLAAVLARNVLERRRELALLRAVGFTPKHVRTIVLSESMLLVGAGLLLGTATALVAVLPALLERTTSIPVRGLGLLLAGVAVTAAGAALAAARLAGSVGVVAALKGE